ncbi:MAG: DnaJ domain-containing protein [Proteobacteria bacterium]|nr:DnaJ domain-containing protein [Pseudomonadota bacterium]
MLNYYETLGISRNANSKEIRKAYYKLAITAHPDREEGSNEKFRTIQEAYETLSDPIKRRQYDFDLSPLSVETNITDPDSPLAKVNGMIKQFCKEDSVLAYLFQVNNIKNQISELINLLEEKLFVDDKLIEDNLIDILYCIDEAINTGNRLKEAIKEIQQPKLLTSNTLPTTSTNALEIRQYKKNSTDDIAMLDKVIKELINFQFPLRLLVLDIDLDNLIFQQNLWSVKKGVMSEQTLDESFKKTFYNQEDLDFILKALAHPETSNNFTNLNALFNIYIHFNTEWHYMGTTAVEQKQKLANFIAERLYMRLAAELGKRMAKGLITPLQITNYSHGLINGFRLNKNNEFNDLLSLAKVNRFNYLIYENYCQESGNPITELPLYTEGRHICNVYEYERNSRYLFKKIMAFLAENNHKSKTYSFHEIESMEMVAISIMQLGNSVYSPEATLTNLSAILEGHVENLVEKNTGFLSLFKNLPIVDEYKEIISYIKKNYPLLKYLPPIAVKLKSEIKTLEYTQEPMLLASNTTVFKTENSFSLSNISMQILGGFIATLGIAAVALAFIVLNASTLGLAGIVIAGVGFAAALAGTGLFATGTYNNCKKNDVDDGILPAPPALD